MADAARALRLVLIGDGASPHLVKWARALAAQPGLELYAASSTGFAAGLEALLPESHRLALGTVPDAAGGNVALLRELPRLASWLRRVRPDWLHAHYLTSHGTLAWLATRLLSVPGRIAGSAWGSDILVTPQQGPAWAWLTRRVLAACTLCTSDSQVMATRMRELGAGEVMVFPFGLEQMPPPPPPKDPLRVFANRGLEPIYRPERVLEVFAAMAAQRPGSQLVLANDGSLRPALQARAHELGLAGQVRFTGRLDAAAQAQEYAAAQWYVSLPRSDSVSVSVLEAMAHGCIPIVSELPANRELVRDGDNGLVLAEGALPAAAALQTLLTHGEAIAGHNRAWVQRHALFAPAVQAFVERLNVLGRA